MGQMWGYSYRRWFRSGRTALLVTLAATSMQAQVPSASAPLQPAGMVAANGRLYVADPATRTIYFRQQESEAFEVFSRDVRFKAPTGLAADEGSLYVADPDAKAIFRVDKQTRVVEELPIVGTRSFEPFDLTFSTSYSIQERQILRRDELLVLDKQSKTVYRLGLDGKNELSVVPLPAGVALDNPSRVSRAGRHLLLADPGTKAILEWSGGSSWAEILRPAEQGRTTSFHFPQLDAPRSVTYSRGIYFVADQHSIRAIVNGGQRVVPLVYGADPVRNPDRVLVDGESLLISDGGRIVKWPLLEPITVEVEAREYANDVLSSLYLYLWNQGLLPLEEVELPYRYPGGICSSVQCILKARRLLSLSNLNITKILCGANPDYCVRGSLTRLPAKGTLRIPLVPYESYLWIDERVLDGKSSVRKILHDWIPDQEMRERVDADWLQALNPQIKTPDIFAVNAEGLAVKVPIERYRYYVPVLREELFTEGSDLLKIVHSYHRLTVRSLESAPFSSPGFPNVGKVVNEPTGKLESAYDAVLRNMDYRRTEAGDYGNGLGQTIVLAETALACEHPVFYLGKHGAFVPPCEAAGAIDGSGEGYSLEWDGNADQGWHGTCVASLAGARQLPYGPALAPRVELRLITLSDITDAVSTILANLKGSPIVVNISQGNSDGAAEQSWRNILNRPWLGRALFVAAAGNSDQLLLGSKMPPGERSARQFPAQLADEFPTVISVGALASSGGIWKGPPSDGQKTGSNHGEGVEILAPGEAVPCAVSVHQEQKATPIYSLASGTSMAAPLVSSLAALLMQRNLTPIETKARILATAIPVSEMRDSHIVAVYGKLSVARALLDPNKLHVTLADEHESDEWRDPDDDGELTVVGTSLNYELIAYVPPGQESSTTIKASDILSLHRLDSDDQGQWFYRLVLLEAGRVKLYPRVRVIGCFGYRSVRNGKKKVLRFADACSLVNDSDQVYANPIDVIGQRLGTPP